jgi:hypothetical protein
METHLEFIPLFSIIDPIDLSSALIQVLIILDTTSQ